MQVTHLAWPGGTSAKWMPRTAPAAEAIVSVATDDLGPDRIVPSPLDPRVAPEVAAAVAKAAEADGVTD